MTAGTLSEVYLAASPNEPNGQVAGLGLKQANLKLFSGMVGTKVSVTPTTPLYFGVGRQFLPSSNGVEETLVDINTCDAGCVTKSS